MTLSHLVIYGFLVLAIGTFEGQSNHVSKKRRLSGQFAVECQLGPVILKNPNVWNLKPSNCVIGNNVRLVEPLEEIGNSVCVHT